MEISEDPKADLANGKRLTRLTWPKEDYIFYRNGKFWDQDGDPSIDIRLTLKDWIIYEGKTNEEEIRFKQINKCIRHLKDLILDEITDLKKHYEEYASVEYVTAKELFRAITDYEHYRGQGKKDIIEVESRKINPE